MDDYISREQALNTIRDEIAKVIATISVEGIRAGKINLLFRANKSIRQAIRKLPSAEKTGRWILVDEAEPRRYGCPYCKRLSYTMDNYCSYCGARLFDEDTNVLGKDGREEG